MILLATTSGGVAPAGPLPALEGWYTVMYRSLQSPKSRVLDPTGGCSQIYNAPLENKPLGCQLSLELAKWPARYANYEAELPRPDGL